MATYSKCNVAVLVAKKRDEIQPIIGSVCRVWMMPRTKKPVPIAKFELAKIKIFYEFNSVAQTAEGHYEKSVLGK